MQLTRSYQSQSYICTKFHPPGLPIPVRRSLPIPVRRSLPIPVRRSIPTVAEYRRPKPLNPNPPVRLRRHSNRQPVAEKSSAAPAATVNSIVGAPERAAAGFTEVKVFYGTDRNRETITATSPETLKAGVLATLALLICATGLLVFNRLKTSLAFGGLAGMLFVGLYWWQQDAPMRDGITYGVDRGSLVRGVSTVTVPKAHQRGMVERPSILRLEFEEDKNKHVVLAKATELNSELNFISKCRRRCKDPTMETCCCSCMDSMLPSMKRSAGPRRSLPIFRLMAYPFVTVGPARALCSATPLMRTT